MTATPHSLIALGMTLDPDDFTDPVTCEVVDDTAREALIIGS